ncbi:transposable element Tc1 transposase [Trichonephila clavipes]|nr:transposable element Tc1 transposase [Trichonephila clavipes]
MPGNLELYDIEKGVVIRYHINGQSLRDISSELNIPKLAVAFAVKVKGDCLNVLRPSRSTKLRDKDQRVLSKEIRKQRLKLIAHRLQELQKTLKKVILINVVHKEAHLLGFHGLAAPHKPLITKTKHVARFR